jgi:hypothetical protein
MDDTNGGRSRGEPPGAGVESYLRGFRRRSLTADLLRLALAAALVNEAYRWVVIGASRLLDLSIPFINIGPLFILVAFLPALGRWSMKNTALKADRLLDLQDRLVSYLDFSRRKDVTETFRAAQAGETVEALEPHPLKRVRPFKAALFLGPMLLAASIYYPYFLQGSVIWRVVRHPGTDLIHMSSRPERAPSADRPAGQTDSRETATGEADQPEQDVVETGHSRDVMIGDEDRPEADLASLMGTSELTYHITSRTVDRKVSRVVPALLTGPGEKEEARRAKVVPKGSMTFRLFPSESGDGEGDGSGAFGVGPATEVVVDYDDIPERYRELVQNYFTILARDLSGELKERR